MTCPAVGGLNGFTRETGSVVRSTYWPNETCAIRSAVILELSSAAMSLAPTAAAAVVEQVRTKGLVTHLYDDDDEAATLRLPSTDSQRLSCNSWLLLLRMIPVMPAVVV